MLDAKGDEKAEMFYLGANEVACHRCVDADRRHEASESGTKDFMTHSIGRSQSGSLIASLSLKAHKNPTYSGLHTGKEPWAGGAHPLLAACSLFRREM